MTFSAANSWRSRIRPGSALRPIVHAPGAVGEVGPGHTVRKSGRRGHGSLRRTAPYTGFGGGAGGKMTGGTVTDRWNGPGRQVRCSAGTASSISGSASSSRSIAASTTTYAGDRAGQACGPILRYPRTEAVAVAPRCSARSRTRLQSLRQVLTERDHSLWPGTPVLLGEQCCVTNTFADSYRSFGDVRVEPSAVESVGICPVHGTGPGNTAQQIPGNRTRRPAGGAPGSRNNSR